MLVCTDSAATRAFVQDILAPTCEVVLAATGEEAIRLAHVAPPEVVLCDLVLPDIDGAEVLRAFRADPALAAIPFLTASARDGDDARALDLEAFAADYERLLEAQEALLHAERLATVGVVAAEVSHEVNTPLSYVKSGSSALLDLLAQLGATTRAAGAPGAAPLDAAGLAARLEDARELAAEVRHGVERLERVSAALRSGVRRAGHDVPDEAATRAAWNVAIGRATAAVRRILQQPAAGAALGPRPPRR
ncbi:MAG TPA: response regulator [Anaeromyxobacteraceae bacterium]|nr:response regulator [Anaeromyxobacteraceae bacterium]